MRGIGKLVNTRKKTAGGFVKAPCIWNPSMLRTTISYSSRS